jgi:hypothetical protein
MDERFNNRKHFWMSCVKDKPKNLKKLPEQINLYADVDDFSIEEKIAHTSDLTGIFPFDLVMTRQVKDAIDRHAVPPVGAYDKDLKVAWFIPREVIEKKTKNGKPYWIVSVVDTTSTVTKIKCWGIKEHDQIFLNRPYLAKLDYSEEWGFSTRSIRHTFRMLG